MTKSSFLFTKSLKYEKVPFFFSNPVHRRASIPHCRLGRHGNPVCLGRYDHPDVLGLLSKRRKSFPHGIPGAVQLHMDAASLPRHVHGVVLRSGNPGEHSIRQHCLRAVPPLRSVHHVVRQEYGDPAGKDVVI